jgi:hypothetical protein
VWAAIRPERWLGRPVVSANDSRLRLWAEVQAGLELERRPQKITDRR